MLGLLGVLNLPQAAQTSDPEDMQEAHIPAQLAEPAPAEVAAESFAAATGGAVVADPEQPGRAPDDPLTDAEKAACVAMVKEMSAAERKAFTIHFRNAFKVPSEEKAIAPLMVSFKHLDFVDRFTGEAAGVPKP
ncbi:MAG: hypothetical protein EBV53_05950 [Proteobacteria bacterium]|nr:hypothetical protein [Pseudomonadota bacterium]